MVTFNELRIGENGSCIIIDVEITGLDIYKNMYIKSISLDYYADVTDGKSQSLPGSKSYKLYDNQYDDDSVRRKRISVPESILPLTKFSAEGFEKGLFFVTVVCDGNLPATAMNFACGFDDTVKIGVIADWKSFYSIGMQYVSRLANGCADPCLKDPGFEDFILQWNALKLAISTCNWPMVASLWDKLMRVHYSNAPAVVGGCGCGR